MRFQQNALAFVPTPCWNTDRNSLTSIQIRSENFHKLIRPQSTPLPVTEVCIEKKSRDFGNRINIIKVSQQPDWNLILVRLFVVQLIFYL